MDEERLRYALETAGKSDRVVDTIADDLEQWLDDLWQRKQTPELSSLDSLRTRLARGIKSSAAALDDESTAFVLLLMADDLDSLADEVAEASLGRGDVGLPSSTFRRHVLQMGLPMQHVMVGEIAIELVNSAIEYSIETGLVGGDRGAPFREVDEVFATMTPPRSDSARLLVAAVRCACKYALGDMDAATEHAEVFLAGVRRESFRNVDPSAKQYAIEVVGVYGAKAYVHRGDLSSAVRVTEFAESIARQHLDEVPVAIYAQRLDCSLEEDPVGSLALATTLLGGLMSRHDESHNDVLRIAYRMVVATAFVDPDQVHDLVRLWRSIALNAPPSVGATEILENLREEDEDGNPVVGSDDPWEIPDDLSGLDD